jgi:molybdopterin-containing oxidoreductase family iron-sulfur binding subunit
VANAIIKSFPYLFIQQPKTKQRSMENKNTYWKGLDELNNDPKFLRNKKNEFAQGIPLEEVFTGEDGELTSNRRDFLKYFGFSISAVTLAACNKAPVKNAIPYIVKPENVTPGIPNWYASTCGACASGCSVLVKTREGRPIKIEGNDQSPIFQGGLCASGQASLLGLYDNERLKGPMADMKATDWNTLDSKVTAALAAAKNIRLVSGTVNSPTTMKAINEFRSKYPSTKHVIYEPLSTSALIEANGKSFGKAVVPGYRFDKAKVIVSFGADFLGTWISPVEYTKNWVKNRKVTKEKPEMSRHFQFESTLTITGASADVRIPIKPSAEGVALISLYNKIAAQAGAPAMSAVQNVEFAVNMIEIAARELWAAKGASLVVCGSNNTEHQLIVNAINSMLGNIGNTVDLDNYSNQRQGNDAAFEAFVNELSTGEVDAVIFYNTNPLYSYHTPKKLEEGIRKAAFSLSTCESADETSMFVKFLAPDHHYLESWNDAEPKAGYISFTQPTISPVYNTRQAQESFLKWAGNTADYYTYLRNNWKSNGLGSEESWNKCLHDGFLVSTPKVASAATASSASLPSVNTAYQAYTASKDKLELKLYAKVGLGDGRHANNPWLQELPDPISKVCWDNYAAIDKVTADKYSLRDGDMVKIATKNAVIASIPVLIQPGQANHTVSIAVGYGRTAGGKVAKYVGQNAYPLTSFAGSVNYSSADVTLEKIDGEYELAQTQTHHTIEGRSLIREASLNEYVRDPKAGNHLDAHIITLWAEHDAKGHKWGMAVDMNACTGCGACVVACNAENNVPVVGRQEILVAREMHWIRIDRYYTFKDKNGSRVTREKSFAGKSLKKENEQLIDTSPGSDTNFEDVSVVFQPLMCQQCGHAPCETVCPVLATVHSSEGLNQMAYNRCVGTRYCANNCPFKVRRFNWFKYHENEDFDFYMNNDLGRMVINPDVTVRSRGVMEKCSFCIQRIQAGKLEAKMEGRKLRDGDIRMACQQTCPSNALVFGDMNDRDSEISKLFRNERSYAMLEEYDVQPSVKYLTKIRNVDHAIAGDHKPSGQGAHGDEHGGHEKKEEMHHEGAEQHS